MVSILSADVQGPGRRIPFRMCLSGMYSEKTDKTYDATIVLDDTGGEYVNFKLEFAARKGGTA